jgi:hypothetical protein
MHVIRDMHTDWLFWPGSQVWGFDILLDEDLRAWLIEANTCPALAGDTPLDKRVKTNMVADVMNMVSPQGRGALCQTVFMVSWGGGGVPLL